MSSFFRHPKDAVVPDLCIACQLQRFRSPHDLGGCRYAERRASHEPGAKIPRQSWRVAHWCYRCLKEQLRSIAYQTSQKGLCMQVKSQAVSPYPPV